MNTEQSAIDLKADKLLPCAIVALLTIGSCRAQARAMSQAGDVLKQDLTPIFAWEFREIKNYYEFNSTSRRFYADYLPETLIKQAENDLSWGIAA